MVKKFIFRVGEEAPPETRSQIKKKPMSNKQTDKKSDKKTVVILIEQPEEFTKLKGVGEGH